MMASTQSLTFAIVLIVLSFAIRFTTSQKDGNNNKERRKVFMDLSVLHGQNSTTGIDESTFSSYICMLDIQPNATRHHDYDYLPVNNKTYFDLCRSGSLSSLSDGQGNGFYVFKFSLTCGAEEQLDHFEKHFPHATALIFSTPCDLNLRSYFNLSNEYLASKRFRLSVITDEAMHRLLTFKAAQEIESDEADRSLDSMITIFSIACFCVIVGAFWSGRVRYTYYEASQSKSQRSALVRKDGSTDSKRDRSQEAFADLTMGSIVFAVVITIIVLLSLYFFYKYIVFFFIFIFVLFSGISFFVCWYHLLGFILPRSISTASFVISARLLCINRLSIAYFSLPLIPLSIALPIAWFCIRHTSENAWILQDVLCICFCIFQLRTLRLPSFKICFILLSALFVYDIFFVFITPLFTTSGISIMEYVATGGGLNRGLYTENRCPGEKAEVLPLSIRTPKSIFGRNPKHPRDFCIGGAYSLLGLGDIIIPGIMVSYSNAFDRIRSVPYRAYFVASSFGYFLGLLLSYVALIKMDIAQPALLYLVPTTTISVILVALIRKEFRQFWIGPEKPLVPGGGAASANTSDSTTASAVEAETSSLKN